LEVREEPFLLESNFAAFVAKDRSFDLRNAVSSHAAVSQHCLRRDLVWAASLYNTSVLLQVLFTLGSKIELTVD
jgi:hypothetical protein